MPLPDMRTNLVVWLLLSWWYYRIV